MLSATFIGEVQQGQIHVPLTEFEGKKVVVTLTVQDATAPVTETPDKTAHLVVSEEPDILEDLGRIRMPRRNVTTVNFHFVDVGRRPMRVYKDDDCEIWDE